MAGAQLLGDALSELLGQTAVKVGVPKPALAADWRVELDAALPDLRALQSAVAEGLLRGRPITVLNRCAASLATLPAVMRASPDVCVLWFDAHADSNTPEQTKTGYLGGMVLTGATGCWDTGLGAGLPLSSIVLVGSRDLDACEQQLVDCGALRLVEPGPGLGARLLEAVGGRSVYVHLDCDVLDAGLMPSEFQISGALSFNDMREAVDVLSQREVVGVEIAEFEATWPNGQNGDLAPFITAISPLLNL